MSNTQPPQQNTTQIRRAIIEAALPDIIFDGWNMETLENAATKDGIDSLTVKTAFPNGVIDALDAFADLADTQMLEALNSTDINNLRIRDRIRTALIARFEYLNQHKEAVQESMKFWINPLNEPKAAKIVWRSADKIWNWAGDTATDYNRQTKRGLLSAIIAPAMIIWANDHSDDMSKTKSFIDKRISNIMTMGKFISRFKKAS